MEPGFNDIWCPLSLSAFIIPTWLSPLPLPSLFLTLWMWCLLFSQTYLDLFRSSSIFILWHATYSETISWISIAQLVYIFQNSFEAMTKYYLKCWMHTCKENDKRNRLYATIFSPCISWKYTANYSHAV